MKELNVFNKKYKIIDLSNIGMADWVFDLVTAIEFIMDAANAGQRILGGDILKPIDGKYAYCYDNWYSESHDVAETRDTALNYLRKYLQKFPNVDWVVSVTIPRH